MNPYIIGGGVLIIAIMGFLLKGAYERTGELEAKLETQVEETIEAVQANHSNLTTIQTLTKRIKIMIEERRIDTVRREKVLDEREQQLTAARAESARLQEERDEAFTENPDCIDLASLSVEFFCPINGNGLRERSTSQGSNGD